MNRLQRKAKVAALGFQSGNSGRFHFAANARTSGHDRVSIDHDWLVNDSLKQVISADRSRGQRAFETHRK
jgi:hypothetical protein